MRLGLRLKLFLVLLLVCAALVACMGLVVQWSFQRGFVELVEQRQRERIAAVVERLAQEYRSAGGWQRVRSQRSRWVSILYPERASLVRRLSRQGRPPPPGTAQHWPPQHRSGGQRRPRPLEHRMVLLDENRTLLVGLTAPEQDRALHAIRDGERLVGWLGVLPGPALNAVADIRFMQRQRSTFVVIALAMVLAAAALAFPLAGVLTRRLRDMATAVRELALGNHQVRVRGGAGDELGRLAQDLNELARTLERNETSRRQWVADVSHELRTPLSVLRGELEALQDGVRPLTPEAVDSLHADTLRLGRLVDDLYDLARADLGALQYRKREVDAVALLRADLEAMAPQFTARDIDVELEYDPGAAASGRGSIVHGDPDRLSQLFRNLLANSLRYTDAGGRLLLQVHATAQQLVLSFQDSAPGVPDDDLPRLFQRFHRVESSRSRDHGGAGLGLAICERIVAAHGGDIEAHASRLGGLDVTVRLPRES
jgi:two-component system sensor histidine kinase BaeS